MLKKQNYVQAVAALLIFFFICDFFHKDKTDLVIPPGGNAVINTGNVVINTPTGSTTHYVPPDGNITVIHSTSSTTSSVNTVVGTNGNTNFIIIIDDRGWCKNPGVGAVFSDRLLFQLDVKFFYYKRYSGSVGINKEFINIGLYRHVDDLIKLKNLEFGIVGGIDYTGRSRYGIALRLNL